MSLLVEATEMHPVLVQVVPAVVAQVAEGWVALLETQGVHMPVLVQALTAHLVGVVVAQVVQAAMVYQAQEVVRVVQDYTLQFLVLIQHTLEVVVVGLALGYQIHLAA
jgi:hypothetical protein